MNATAALALAGLSWMAGCAAEARIERMQLDLAQSLSEERDATAFQLEKRILEIAGHRWGVTSLETAETKADVADTYACWRRRQRALELASESLADMERALGEDDPELVQALAPLARSHLCSFDWKAGEAVVDRIAEICRGPAALSNPWRSCSAELDVFNLYVHAGAHRKAVDAFIVMHEVRMYPPDPLTRQSMLTEMGRRLAEGGYYAEASWYLRRCLEEALGNMQRPASAYRTIWKNRSGDVQLETRDSAHDFASQEPKCLENLIEISRRTGDAVEADRLEAWSRQMWSQGPDVGDELEKRVQQIDRTQRDDFLTAYDLNTLGYYYLHKARLTDAIRAYEEAIRRYDRGAGRDRRGGRCIVGLRILDPMLGLGSALERSGRFADAENVYRRADTIAVREVNPHHEWRLETLARLAQTISAQDRLAEAEKSWLSYLDRAREQRSENHPDYAFGLAGLADVLASVGRHAESRATRSRADAIWEKYAQDASAIRQMPLPASLLSPPSPAN